MFALKAALQIVIGLLMLIVAALMIMVAIGFMTEDDKKPEEFIQGPPVTPSPTQTPLPATQQVIESALLKVNDLPGGWFVQASATSAGYDLGFAPPLYCGNVSPTESVQGAPSKTVTQGSADPLVVSAHFQRGTGAAGPYFGQTLRAYPPGSGPGAWEALAEELRACSTFSRTAPNCSSTSTSIKATTWNEAELSIGSFGERSIAFRLWGNECNVEVVIHLLLIQRGNVVQEIFYASNNPNIQLNDVGNLASLSDRKPSVALGLPRR